MSIHRNVPLHKPRWVGEAQQACQYLRGPATKRISTPGSHACGQAHLFQCVVVVVVLRVFKPPDEVLPDTLPLITVTFKPFDFKFCSKTTER